MSEDNWQDNHGDSFAPVEKPPVSPGRLGLERFAIGAVAVVVLLLPIIFALMFYLAMSDGIEINSGDPFHAVRLWMVQERRGATGLGLTIANPSISHGTLQCAFTNVTFLKWDRSLRLETDPGYCRCFELKAGQWTESPSQTCQ